MNHFQGHYIIKTLKMTLVCTLSHESLDGIVKLAQILYWDEGKKWLDFGNLDSFSRSHWHFETQFFIEKKKLVWHIDINKVYLHKRK